MNLNFIPLSYLMVEDSMNVLSFEKIPWVSRYLSIYQKLNDIFHVTQFSGSIKIKL